MKTIIGFFGGIGVSLWMYQSINYIEQNNKVGALISALAVIFLLRQINESIKNEQKEEKMIAEILLPDTKMTIEIDTTESGEIEISTHQTQTKSEGKEDDNT